MLAICVTLKDVASLVVLPVFIEYSIHDDVVLSQLKIREKSETFSQGNRSLGSLSFIKSQGETLHHFSG